MTPLTSFVQNWSQNVWFILIFHVVFIEPDVEKEFSPTYMPFQLTKRRQIVSNGVTCHFLRPQMAN